MWVKQQRTICLTEVTIPKPGQIKSRQKHQIVQQSYMDSTVCSCIYATRQEHMGRRRT